ncbi:MAG: glycosyltransferase family 39 protein [Cyanobacteriota bacterium]|nr:glycosyltransferase family 39 protein [Cyanobacteriota bacterium]
MDQSQPNTRWLKQFAALLLIVGIAFRFVNLGHKVYWYDEVHTSLRSSGYVLDDVIPQAYTGQLIQAGDFVKIYQYPTAEKNLGDALEMFKKHPEHSPFYYFLARFWMQTFGHSVTTIRCLSALISLLCFPALYWLCFELFQSSTVGWVAMGILAISPFHVLYAQEARAYSLWTFTILFSSAAFLRALRVSQTQKFIHSKLLAWGVYTFSLTLGLYSHLFAIFVALAHALYGFGLKQWRKFEYLFPALGSILLSFLFFLPWLIIILTNSQDFIDNTSSHRVTRPGTMLFWGLNLTRLSFDFNQGYSLLNPILYIIIFITIYSIYFLIKKTPTRTCFFLISLMGTMGMALILPDLLWGGQRSTIARYGIPSYLGLQITLAYLLNQKVRNCSLNWKQSQRWKYLFLGLGISGILSCLVSSIHPVWWHKSYTRSRYIPAVAKIINASPSPLVISDSEPGRILPFSHQLKPDVYLQLVVQSNIPLIPDREFSDIFLYRPSEVLIAGIEDIYNTNLEKVYKKGWLWRVELPIDSQSNYNRENRNSVISIGFFYGWAFDR